MFKIKEIDSEKFPFQQLFGEKPNKGNILRR